MQFVNGETDGELIVTNRAIAKTERPANWTLAFVKEGVLQGGREQHAVMS